MPKRSCDLCMRRKTKCDNGHPCRKCTEARPPLECTYLAPVLKRGPKTSKLLQRSNERWDPRGNAARKGVSGKHSTPEAEVSHRIRVKGSGTFGESGYTRTRRLSVHILSPIIEAYRSRMYPVWPVVDSKGLIARLEREGQDGELDMGAYTLAVALCSGTMAQLDLAPVKDGSCDIDSAYLERECARVRSLTNYRQHPSVDEVLASFFLHVYHAKVDNRNAAMVFLQEAISLARLLHMDEPDEEAFQPNKDFGSDNTFQRYLCYILLWVSERGYAAQHGFPISVHETIEIPSLQHADYDVYGEGLIELASLFAAFDSQFRRKSRYKPEISSSLADKQLLVTIHESLTNNSPRPANYDIVQRADYHFTKQWMRTLLWQQAMSQGLLSSVSDVESMTFLFPSRIAQDLLASITMLSRDDLLPLGRDQLMKSFEITNSLADVILCAPPNFMYSSSQKYAPGDFHNDRNRDSNRECCRYGPPDFLHGLYQTISPFLEHDIKLRDMLRQKAADALLRSPSRVVPSSIGRGNEDEDVEHDVPIDTLEHRGDSGILL